MAPKTTKKTAAPATEPGTEPTRKPRLTNAQRRDAWSAAGGKCFVFGVDVDPFSSFDVDNGRLIGEAAKGLKGSESLEALRDKLQAQLAKTREAVKATKDRHDLAVAAEALYRKTFAPLIGKGDSIAFAGEKAGKTASEKPVETGEPANGEAAAT